MMPASAPRVVAVLGPTAVGKTEAVLDLAEAVAGEIVSLDSRQMVRGMDIGTAKPSPAERARVPHHLVDIADIDAPLDLATVQRLAFAAVEAILARGRLPILVGGTGQYLWSVIEGWRIPDIPPDPALRAELAALAEREGAPALHARLAAVDPVAAARIDPRNVRRVVRALEVQRLSGRPISEQQARPGSPYTWWIAGLRRPRPALYARIDRRIEAMLAAGLEQEVRALVAAGHGFDLPAMSSLGYREWQAYFEGRAEREAVLRAIRRNTRILVRRQGAWFRAADPRIDWFDLEAEAGAGEPAAPEGDPGLSDAGSLLRQRLADFLAGRRPGIRGGLAAPGDPWEDERP